MPEDPTDGGYRVHPFNVSSFSSPVLLDLPDMDSEDEESFLLSLKAKGTRELVDTARLWEYYLLESYPVPFFLVRVADMRASLGSGATALTLYKEAQELIPSDPIFEEFVENFEKKCLSDEEHKRSAWSQGVFNQPWKPASKTLFPTVPMTSDSMLELQRQWKEMSDPAGESMQQYMRYASLETNIMENTFLLHSRSVVQLVRDGYDESAVEYLEESAIHDKGLITDIMRDTYEALEMIVQVAEAPERLTVDFICDIHRVCMRSSRIVPWASPDGEDGLVIKYMNVGVTRQLAKKNMVVPGPPRVQFCPFDNIMEELGKFIHLAKQWLKNWKRNPFATAAWMHLVFVSCHPFEDGNGRIARLIASIPLIQAGLPPLCISPSSKKAYFDALGQARGNNFEPLIECFVQALNDSASTIESMQ